ncbi:MAG: flippase-like domain-containing protein [Chloroflexi bacterium]|nr:flippase-like domain-containing protein [Chloroflexota bacterium]
MTLGVERRAAPSSSLIDTRQVFIGAIFSLIFIALALRDVQVGDVANSLRQVSPVWLVFAVASFVLTSLAKAARWKMLFSLQQPPSLARSYSILSIGVLLNSFAPARLGELARAFLIGEAETGSKMYALGTIAIEKVADLVFLMFSVSLLLSQMALPDWLAGPAKATGVSILILLPVFLLLAWVNGFVLRTLERFGRFTPPSWIDWLLQKARQGLESLQILRTPRLVILLVFWSLLIWILGISTNYLVFGAMGMDLNALAALLLLVVLQVGVAVPSSPGRIGVFHYLTILTLSVFAVDKGTALGYSIMLYLVIYVPITVMGGYFLWRERITWQRLMEAAAALGRLRKAK